MVSTSDLHRICYFQQNDWQVLGCCWTSIVLCNTPKVIWHDIEEEGPNRNAEKTRRGKWYLHLTLVCRKDFPFSVEVRTQHLDLMFEWRWHWMRGMCTRTLYVDRLALFRENWHLKDNWLFLTIYVTWGRGGCGGRGGAARINKCKYQAYLGLRTFICRRQITAWIKIGALCGNFT